MLNALANGTAGYDANGDVIFPRDAADDNYNAFDVWPPRLTGEVGDTDYYDSAGALLLPVERMRRFVTPVDINGTGRVHTWNLNSDYGPDNFGRVQFSSYFRPAGAAGFINVTTPFPTVTNPQTIPGSDYPLRGAITPGPYSPNTTPPYGIYSTWSLGAPTTLGNINYYPDLTNNPLHGYELYKIPNQFQFPGGTGAVGGADFGNPTAGPASLGGMPIDQNALSTTNFGGSTHSSAFLVVYPDHRPELGYAAQSIQSRQRPGHVPDLRQQGQFVAKARRRQRGRRDETLTAPPC